MINHLFYKIWFQWDNKTRNVSLYHQKYYLTKKIMQIVLLFYYSQFSFIKNILDIKESITEMRFMKSKAYRDSQNIS